MDPGLMIFKNEEEDYDTQVAFARNATITMAPTGAPFPTQTASTISSTSSVAATKSSPVSKSSSAILSPGAIAGIAISGLLITILAIALVYLCGRQKTLSEILHRSNAQSDPLSPPPQYHHPVQVWPQKSPMYNSGGYGEPVREVPGSPVSQSSGLVTVPLAMQMKEEEAVHAVHELGGVV